LLRDAEQRCDLRPGPAVGSRLGHLIDQAQLAGRDGVQRLADGTEVRAD